jgi:hypothetical protein
MDQVRSTLQLLNKMIRKEAKPVELAALVKIKEVREILELLKVNPKEASESLSKYQKDLTARLRAHDRSKRSVDDSAPSAGPTAESPALKKSRPEESTSRPSRRQNLTGILSQSELAMPPTGAAPTQFDVEWLQYFFQLMCSKVPFFSDRKFLLPCVPRTYIEESDDQRVFTDGLSNNEIILLLNFIFDLESNLVTKKESRVVIIPNKFVFIPVMGDPLESGLLDSWYYTHQNQCATCGLRFASRQLLTEHHDYHYHKYTAMQRRKRGLENNFRGWMETPSEWLGTAGMEFTPGSFFEKKLSVGLKNGGFFGKISDEEMNPAEVHEIKPSSAMSHTAHTVTALQQIATDLLPSAIPVDEIKCRCMECGESFEKKWIGEPLDMAVFADAVALPVGGGVALQFTWPVKTTADDTIDVDDDEEEDATNSMSIDATNALFDQRFVNAIFVHKECLTNNPGLRTREYQLKLLDDQCTNKIVNLLCNEEEVFTAEVIEEIDDEDDGMDVVA